RDRAFGDVEVGDAVSDRLLVVVREKAEVDPLSKEVRADLDLVRRPRFARVAAWRGEPEDAVRLRMAVLEDGCWELSHQWLRAISCQNEDDSAHMRKIASARPSVTDPLSAVFAPLGIVTVFVELAPTRIKTCRLTTPLAIAVVPSSVAGSPSPMTE